VLFVGKMSVGNLRKNMMIKKHYKIVKKYGKIAI